MTHPEINLWGVSLKTFVLDADKRRKTLIFSFYQRESAFTPYLRSVQVSAFQNKFGVNHVSF
jgi:hypothetical protein